jgi:hypothetical protein
MRLTCTALAASGGPDAFGYTWKDSTGPGGPEFQFIEPGPLSRTILENNSAAVATLTLDQPWGGIYGVPVTAFRVSRNGFLSDDPADPGSDETNDAPLPAKPSAGGGNRIYVLHDNLELDSTNGKVRYEYHAGSPHPLHGCGVHVITWENVRHGTGAAFDFQVLLFDNLDILMQFPAGNPEEGSGSTTGIQNAASSQGLTVYANAAGQLAKDISVLISPPRLTVTTVADELNTPAGAVLSLREAVRDAPSGWRIGFDPILSAGTIDLSVAGGGQGSRIEINGKVLAIDAAPLALPPALSGGGAVRHLHVIDGAWLSLAGLQLELGSITGTAGSTTVDDGATLVASGCAWLDNFATGDGGALLVTGAAKARFNTTDFFRNGSNSSGGAISGKVNGVIVAEKCRFWRNRAGDDGSGNGGAIALNTAVLTLRHCDLALNAAADSGGAVVANVNSTVNGRGSTFDHNRANFGGGIAAENASTVAGTPPVGVFERCTFYRNFALNSGGALYESTTTTGGLKADLALRYCTVVENHAGISGAGFQLQDSVVEIAASILAYNRLPNGEDNLAASGGGSLDSSFGDNLESGNEAGFGANAGLSNALPKLTPLGYFGGFVRTCLLLEGSPGIDGVTQESYPAGFDARGFVSYRNGPGLPGFGFADVGATERGEKFTVTTAIGNGPGSLSAAILQAHDGGTIGFSGVTRIDVSGPLPVNAGKMVFIEGPEAGGVELIGASTVLSNGETVGIHNATLIGRGPGQFGIPPGETSGSSVTLSHCRIRNETPAFSAPSAITIRDGGRMALLSCDVRTRFDSTLSFAARVEGYHSTLVVRDTRFSGFSSGEGICRGLDIDGGILICQGSSFTDSEVRSSTVEAAVIHLTNDLTGHRPWGFIEQTTIANNRLQVGGSTVAAVAGFAFGSGGTPRLELELVHCTLADNSGSLGLARGIHVQHSGAARARLQMTNSVVAASGLTAISGNGTFVTRGGNLCDQAPAFFGVNDFTNTAPDLYPLSVGHGGSLHRAPRPGSPCIDAGQVRNVWARDGRGGLRFLDGDGDATRQPDIGAVESGRVLAVTTAADENGGLGTGSGDSLRECIAAAAANTGAVNLDLSAVGGTTLGSGLGANGYQVDLDALDAGFNISATAGGNVAFLADAGSLVSLHGVSFPGPAGALEVRENSAATLSRSSVRGSSTTVATVRDTSRLRLAGVNVSRNTAAITVLARDTATLDAERCSFTDQAASSQVVVQLQNSARFDALRCTFARNACANGPLALFNAAACQLQRCTFGSNGRGVFVSNNGRLTFGRTIFSNDSGGAAIYGGSPHRLSLGGNLSEQAVAEFIASDLPNRDPFLAPLADVDGLPALRPLARGPAFGSMAGAFDPPPQVITVTTLADENNSPAGAAISLREAVRDIAPGGAVVFAPALNHGVITLVNSSGQISVTKSVVIDATGLPKGIDVVGRLFSATAGVVLNLHGVHLRDQQAETGNGALLAMTDGTLVASHCTFSGGLISTGGLGGALWMSGCRTVLENCTLTGNRVGLAAAIRLEGGSAAIRHSTIARNTNRSNSGGAIELGGSAALELHGNAFFGNRRNNGAASAPDVAAFTGSVISLGHNASASALSGATGSDSVVNLDPSFLSLGDRGGLVDTLESSAPSARNTVPAGSPGTVPPPLTDARGFSRVAGGAADWGANESGGRAVDRDGDGLPDWWEDLRGFDSDSADPAAADADGDGSSLFEEFQFLTDPADGDSFLNFTFAYNTLVTPTVVLTWNSSPGFLYDVETSETLATWTIADTQTGDGGVRLFQDPITGLDPPRKFYRLRIRE